MVSQRESKLLSLPDTCHSETRWDNSGTTAFTDLQRMTCDKTDHEWLDQYEMAVSRALQKVPQQQTVQLNHLKWSRGNSSVFKHLHALNSALLSHITPFRWRDVRGGWRNCRRALRSENHWLADGDLSATPSRVQNLHPARPKKRPQRVTAVILSRIRLGRWAKGGKKLVFLR